MSHPGNGRGRCTCVLVTGGNHDPICPQYNPWKGEEPTQPELCLLDANLELCKECNLISSGLNTIAEHVSAIQRDVKKMQQEAGPEIIERIAEACGRVRDHMEDRKNALDALYVKAGGK